MVLLDMEMPKSCFDCLLYNQGFCDASSHKVKSNHVIMRTKPSDCPIKAEIPTGASNGDVMMVVFKEVRHYSDGKISAEWWNAQWKDQK